ncbi:transcriptional repressor [Streptomyces sp. NPDC096934]|uniref:transcriptional repressor n=1 Tax=Streptomyces sp. NPDC096934 TaxID=3155551 RepID=UPI0033306BDB
MEICTRLQQTGEILHATTLYRTPETLTKAGLVHGVPCPGPMRYGITGDPHHHTVYHRCGYVAALACDHLPEAAGCIEELTGLRPDASASLLVYGRCTDCIAG